MRKDPTLAKRQADATAKLIEEGGRRITLRVPANINELLNAECKRTGESANAAILRLLQNSLE